MGNHGVQIHVSHHFFRKGEIYLEMLEIKRTFAANKQT